MANLQDKYIKLNNSFKKTFVFHLGVEAGFFSEYNNMILAMLYCLTNKIRFVLYSQDAGFGYEKGWTDFFLPFCDETNNAFHHKYNYRYSSAGLSLIERLKVRLFKRFNKIDYFTSDLWSLFHNRNMELNHYNISDLGISGDINHACSILIGLTWRYNSESQLSIDRLVSDLNLPEKFIGFHIRKGDKGIEHELIDINSYVGKLEDEIIDDIFVLTDDYLVIEELNQSYFEEKVYTLCPKEDSGYIHSEFLKAPKEVKVKKYLNLFASMDILSQSERFIGTFSSNVGMYLGMRMDPHKCIGVDFEDWRVW